MLNISLHSQGFPGLSRATSLCHRSVQLPMACRVINNENNTTRQPRSQTGVEGGQRRMRVRQGCREDNVYLSSLKPAPTGRPLPWPPHKDTVQSSSHPTPSSLVFTGYVFKATVLILESYRGLGTSGSTITNPLTLISKGTSRKASWESDTPLQLKHVTGRQIEMLSDRGSRLTVPVYALQTYYASHTVSCLAQADRRAQTIARRARVVEKYLWISERPQIFDGQW